MKKNYNNYSKQKHCIDCDKPITNRSKRCRKCSHLLTHGKPRLPAYCIDCGKLLSESHYKRCRSCSCKERYKDKKNHPHFKNARYYCIDCGKRVSAKNVKRCWQCYVNFNKGENNPNWQGNISDDKYYCFTKSLKTKIRIRDNFECQHCHMTEKTHKKIYNETLHNHHIDYNKQNYAENNLIILCRRCNSLANGNRDYWFAYYKYIMENYVL